MFCLCIVLLFDLQVLLYSSVKGLCHKVVESLVRGEFFGINASQELKDAECTNEIVTLFMVE